MAEIVLTPGQRAAVESRGCALLVAAAAGSGKTRVLIDRVLDQVIREGRRVDEFLLITFTQAAAAELRGKLLAELNRQKDKKGRPYHFALTTWDEEGIALPPDAA